MSHYMIIGSDGKEYGPATAEQLKDYLAHGRVDLDSLIKPTEGGVWMKLGKYPELTSRGAEPPMLAGSPPPYQRAGTDQSAKTSTPLYRFAQIFVFVVGLGFVALVLWKASDDKKRETRGLVTAAANAFQVNAPQILTKAEWLQKARTVAQIVDGTILAVPRKALFKAVGEPTSSQSQGNQWYFYWECSDGRIQLVAPDPGQYGGMILGGTINGY